MNTKFSPGFTIIEVTLVLAISAVLVVAILATATGSINRQRYQDSVTSFEGLLKQQYISVTRVQNAERQGSTGFECDSSATVSDASPISSEPRGASECVIIGRVINVSGGSDISVFSVIGHESSGPVASPAPTSDLDILKTYHLSLFENSQKISKVGWGSTTDPSDFGILLLRSPSSGNIITLSSTAIVSNSNIESIVDAGLMADDAEICINSEGLFAGKRQTIMIRKDAAGPAGVERLGEAGSC